ncbi:sulfotransferase domain-containing protein [Phthorimaea operculella]|nr:sulfotransferase domain-containing protein [Phthorimaea operculella]
MHILHEWCGLAIVVYDICSQPSEAVYATERFIRTTYNDPCTFENLLDPVLGERTGFVRVGPKGYVLTNKFREEAPKIYNLTVKPDDIYVATFPRSGTTWTQELVWMIANDLDYAGSSATPLIERFPFLEFSILLHPEMMERLKQQNKDKLEILQNMFRSEADHVAEMPSPRFVKTHLPMSLLPPKLLDTAKVVYVARDPRDAAVSFYHHNRLLNIHGYVGNFKTYWNFFIKDLIPWTPFFDHLKEAWECRDHPNMLFLFYEDLVKDLPAAVRKVAKFLNKEYTEEQIAGLCDHLSIDSFKKNKSVNFDIGSQIAGLMNSGEQGFVRKGKSGGWRDYFDEEMMQQADTWMQQNLRDTDLRFPHLEA